MSWPYEACTAIVYQHDLLMSTGVLASLHLLSSNTSCMLTRQVLQVRQDEDRDLIILTVTSLHGMNQPHLLRDVLAELHRCGAHVLRVTNAANPATADSGAASHELQCTQVATEDDQQQRASAAKQVRVNCPFVNAHEPRIVCLADCIMHNFPVQSIVSC